MGVQEVNSTVMTKVNMFEHLQGTRPITYALPINYFMFISILQQTYEMGSITVPVL